MTMTASSEIQGFALQPISRKEVMATAWYIAKVVSADYGVSAKSLLALALKRAWRAVKVTLSVFNGYEDRKMLAFLGFVFNKENKAWEKEVQLTFFKYPQPVKFGRGFITTPNLNAIFKNAKVTKWF